MGTTHKLYKVKNMYVDATIIKDPSCTLFFELATYHKIAIHLVLENITCVQEVEAYDSYGYVSDVVYGSCASTYVMQNNISQEHTAIFERVQQEGILSCMGVQYDSLESFLCTYSKQERSIKRWLITLYVALIAYFTIYFYNIDALPIYMRCGWTLLLYMLLPAVVLMIAMLYGIHRRIFSIWQLLDWI